MTTWDPSNKDSSISLSNANLTASGSVSAWRSVIGTGSGKASGKWYFRVQMNLIGTDTAGAGMCLSIEPTSTLIGADANGWLAYTHTGSAGSIYHNGGNVASIPTLVAAGDYIVVALDANNGGFYATTMTSAGSLNTNWNFASGNPSTATGALAVPTGMALLPGVSFLNAGDNAILDTTSVIPDATLSGYAPFDYVALFSGQIYQPLSFAGRQWRHAFNVIPSDTGSLGSDYLSFANSGAQTIQVTMVGGEMATLTLPSGIYPLRVRRVWATGTTVTNIVAFSR